jgi:hypothetical protein
VLSLKVIAGDCIFGKISCCCEEYKRSQHIAWIHIPTIISALVSDFVMFFFFFFFFFLNFETFSFQSDALRADADEASYDEPRTPLRQISIDQFVTPTPPPAAPRLLDLVDSPVFSLSPSPPASPRATVAAIASCQCSEATIVAIGGRCVVSSPCNSSILSNNAQAINVDATATVTDEAIQQCRCKHASMTM